MKSRRVTRAVLVCVLAAVATVAHGESPGHLMIIGGNLRPDNSAIFLGVLDTTPSIGRIDYRLAFNNIATPGFGINRLDLVTTGAAPTPEPTSLLLLSGGNPAKNK